MHNTVARNKGNLMWGRCNHPIIHSIILNILPIISKYGQNMEWQKYHPFFQSLHTYLSLHELSKQPSQVFIVRRISKPQGVAVIKIQKEFLLVPLTKPIECLLHFVLQNEVVLILLGFSTQTLPGKHSSQEVQQDVAERFQVISSTLFHAQVIVERSVARSSG